MKKYFQIKWMSIILLAVMPFVSACDNGIEDRVWDFDPIVLSIEVVDAQGNDLLNPNTAGNISEKKITATIDGKTYTNNYATSRYYLPNLFGLKTQKGPNGKYQLLIGEFDATKNIGNYAITIDWGDGTTDEFSYSNNLSWDQDNPIFDRHFFQNGKECKELPFVKQISAN